MLLSGRQRPTCRGAGCRLPAALRTADRVRDASRGGQLRSSAGTGHSSLPGQIPPAAFMKKACSEHAAAATSLQLADAALEKRDCLQPPKHQTLSVLCSSCARTSCPLVQGQRQRAHASQLPFAPFPQYLDLPGNYWRLTHTRAALRVCMLGAVSRGVRPSTRPAGTHREHAGCALFTKAGSDEGQQASPPGPPGSRGRTAGHTAPARLRGNEAQGGWRLRTVSLR